MVLWEALQHPSLHRLLEVYWDEEGAQWCLVSEYDAELEDLFNFVDRAGPLPDRDAAAVVRQLTRLCYHLTLLDIDHRDLKDENVLYNPRTRQIKLIDFGSAARLSPAPYTAYRGTDV